MKILMLVDNYPSDEFFQGIRMYETAKFFSREEETDVVVLFYHPAPTAKKVREEIRSNDRLTVIKYGRKYLPRFIHFGPTVNPITLLSYVLITIRETWHNKPDVLMSTVPPFIPVISVYITSMVTKRPYCLDIRDDLIEKKWKKNLASQAPMYSRLIVEILYEAIYRLFTSAIKNAFLISTVYDTMIPKLNVITGGQTPIIYIPNGINLDEFKKIKKIFNKSDTLKKYQISDDKDIKTIIFVGNVGEIYRPDILLEPIKNLIEAGEKIRYIVVGDGKLRTVIVKRAIEMDIEDNVFILGKMPHEDVIELCLASDVAFYAIDKDFPVPECTMGTKILEYIACRLPILCIAEDNFTVSKMVKEKDIGIAINWNELEKVPASIKKLCTDDQYVTNIDHYYPEFLGSYERNTNNKKLFENIVHFYKTP